MSAAAGGPLPVYAANGVCVTTFTNNTFVPGNLWGQGQIKTADGNFTAPYWSNITAAPSSLGNWNSITTAFSGDISHAGRMQGHVISGAATLGQPATGYVYTPEAYSDVHYLYNSSGWNQDTADDNGRTAAVDTQAWVYQHGQGDAVAFNAECTADSTRSGSTSWLANPACVLFNGSANAEATGIYLNLVELDANDNGFDATGIGVVANLNRTNATGANGAWWTGFRAQSQGSAYADSAFSAVGKFSVGLNLVSPTFDANAAAIALPANGRIYGAAGSSTGTTVTALGTNFIYDNEASCGCWDIAYLNASTMEFNNAQVTSLVPFAAESNIVISGTVASGTRLLGWETSGSLRWNLFVNTAAESGANAGSNIFLERYSDTGVFIDSPLSVIRSTGVVSMPDGVSAVIAGGSPPTLTGSCTTGTQVGGNTAGTFAATCSSQTVIITFATTAPHGWGCFAQDQTTRADSLSQTANGATSCTLTGSTSAADTIVFTATAF